MLLKPEDAKLRINQSRLILDHWIVLGSEQTPETMLKIIGREIRSLADLVDQHEHLTDEASMIIAGWVLFRARTRRRCN